MLRIVLFLAVFLTAQAVFGQAGNSILIVVKSGETKEPITNAAAAVKGTEITGASSESGRIEFANIPDGQQTIAISSPGYEEAELTLTFPLADAGERTVFLAHHEFGSVTVTSTRTGREIEDSPTRVEAIDEEEIDEKINMRPANVSMVLNESTGIKVQQTSATSATQSVRIQGLDGRYTQILKDGFPSFGGFSGSLSLLEIPPLDLRQVEIIKGPSATFFGGGAIAGVVNFVSKEPEDEPVTTMVFNQTSALGTDFSIFNSQRFSNFGYTVLGSANYQNEYDVDDDNFSDLPLTHSFAVSPKVFFQPDKKTRLTIGNSTSIQDRKGGDMFVIDGRTDALHQYFEKNRSFRNITTINFDREFSGNRRIVAKQSFAFFGRELELPDLRFKGDQFNSYTDVAIFVPVKRHALVFGFSSSYDQFREDAASTGSIKRDETRTIVGGYAQDTIDITDRLSLEAGLRIDHAKDYGTFALPRVSVLYRLTDELSTRVSYGLGYKTPSIFTEDAEMLFFRNVLPIGDDLKAERSRGGTFDVNYRQEFGEEIGFSLNQMFFYTEITDPLVLRADAGNFRFENAGSSIISRGFETNARFSYDIAKLFLGYTYTDAKAGHLSGDRRLTLLPKNRINSSLIFEEHENFKAGLEAYYTDTQTLDDRSRTRPFWVFGLFGEKTFGKFSLFINAENITDVRQSRFSQVVFPPFSSPTFADVYTHLEGRVFNGGVKIRL